MIKTSTCSYLALFLFLWGSNSRTFRTPWHLLFPLPPLLPISLLPPLLSSSLLTPAALAHPVTSSQGETFNEAIYFLCPIIRYSLIKYFCNVANLEIPPLVCSCCEWVTSGHHISKRDATWGVGDSGQLPPWPRDAHHQACKRCVLCVEGGREGRTDGWRRQTSSGDIDIMVCSGKCIVGLAAADFTAPTETCQFSVVTVKYDCGHS